MKSESQQEKQNCLSVDRAGRLTPSVGRSVNRDQPRALSASRLTAPVDRFLATVDRAAPVHVVHAGRPDPVLAHAAAAYSLLLASDLCAIFLLAADCLLVPFGF